MCGDMGSLGASCFHTLTDDSREIDKHHWDEYRFGMICTKADNVEETKAVIEKLCNETQKCTYDDLKTVERLARRVKRFNVKAKKTLDQMSISPVSSGSKSSLE